MAARNETMAARNMPLTSPPKRTRLDIFGTSAEKASALKASSWHAGTQFSLSEEVEELHGRRAFDEDVSMGQCFNSIGSLGANSSRETASGESPLRRKVASKPDSGGVRVYERDSGRFSDGGSGGVFEMDMGEEVESVAASAPTKQFTGSMCGVLCGTSTSIESHRQTAGWKESPGQGGVKGGAQSEGGVFDMHADVSAGTSTQGTSLQSLPVTDIWGLAAAEKEPSNAGTVGDESSEARASATSEAEASALAVLHAMAAGIVAPMRTHTHTHGIGASAANWSIGAAVAAAASANAANKDSQQLPVLVKSDGTTMIVSEEFLTKMGIPLVAPAALLRAGALPFPQASPATMAASGFMGMSLDTPKGARADAFNSAGAPINTGCDAVLKALGMLSSADMRAATASGSDAGMHSAAVAMLTESIASSASSREYTGAMSHNECEEGLSVADEAAIAALQELGASAGRWSNEGGRGSRAGDSPSGSGPGGSSINSRHGAARGRQVTRSCPGCAERISIACKFCTLCGYTFRRSSTQPSQPSTPRDSMLSPSRTADMSVGALVAAAAAAATEIDDGVDGARTLSALLKRGRHCQKSAAPLDVYILPLQG